MSQELRDLLSEILLILGALRPSYGMGLARNAAEGLQARLTAHQPSG